MPELPEVETVATTLAPRLRGRIIESFELHWERTIAPDTIEHFRSAVLGRTITDVSRRAKYVVVALDDGSAITIHLRMTGELLFQTEGANDRPVERERYLRAVFGLSGGAELLFYDTRKFGRIGWRSPNELARLDHDLGVEPLAPEFTPDTLRQILNARARRIKPLLLDQTVIAGLGNIYVDEALFRAGIHPLRASNSISASRVEALQRAIVDVLSDAVTNRGTTFRDYRSGLGEPGGNQSRLRVYGLKPGTPCPECGAALERLVVAQRGSMYCPVCQPLDINDTPNQ